MVRLLNGIYVGTDKKLFGKSALLLVSDSLVVLRAQFNDVTTRYGYGWHTFSRIDFEIEG